MSGTRQRIAVPSAFLRGRPDRSAEATTELLHGEDVAVTFSRADWAEIENLTDGYRGFIETDALGASGDQATHRVDALRSHIYPEPNLKVTPSTALSFGSRVRPRGERNGFVELSSGGWIFARHLAPMDTTEPDYARTALRFLGVPYLWGGRTSLGLDCSALVQLSLAAAGIAAPRDSGPQRSALGQRVLGDAPPRPRDLVFWPGHVGIMVDGEHIVHANAYFMAVTYEPLAAVSARVEAKPEIRRLY
jgi:cell wall-associated NlpC family hydrolase